LAERSAQGGPEVRVGVADDGAQAHRDSLRRRPRIYTKNLEAYDYYLRALEYFLTPTPDGFVKARKMFEKEIELDPD
jgi:hypothetical protein